VFHFVHPRRRRLLLTLFAFSELRGPNKCDRILGSAALLAACMTLATAAPAFAQKSADTITWRDAIPDVDPYHNSQRTEGGLCAVSNSPPGLEKC